MPGAINCFGEPGLYLRELNCPSFASVQERYCQAFLCISQQRCASRGIVHPTYRVEQRGQRHCSWSSSNEKEFCHYSPRTLCIALKIIIRSSKRAQYFAEWYSIVKDRSRALPQFRWTPLSVTLYPAQIPHMFLPASSAINNTLCRKQTPQMTG